MALSQRENYLRAIEFRNPEWIPVSIEIDDDVWMKYREDLEEVVLAHPKIFGPYEKGSVDFDSQGGGFTDEWGAVWSRLPDGVGYQVVGNPLADYSKLSSYQPPVPLTMNEADKVREDAKRARKEGWIVKAAVNRYFERLHFLRGFENLMLDFASEPPELSILIEMVLDYNMKRTEQLLEIGLDIIWFGDDLGTQINTMVSPKTWRKYLYPGYKKMFQACRKKGVHVYFHSDGHILEFVPDLIECGVTACNPQFRPNTLDGIIREFKGKICVNLDLDMQKIIPFGTPGDIKEHIKEMIEKIGSPKGGLMFYANIQSAVSLENIEALCEAFEEYCLVNKKVIISDLL